MITQGTKIFADWWIGSLKVLPWKLSSTTSMEIYIGLISGFGVVFAITGFIVPAVSNLMCESISSRLVKSIALSDLKWFQQHSSLKISSKLNRDFEEIFHLNNLTQGLFRVLLIFLSTIILVGYRAPIFFGLAAFVILVNIGVLLFFLQVEREVGSLGASHNQTLLTTFEQLITGIDIWRCYGQLQDQRNQILAKVYNTTVCKLNYRFIYHGMAVLSEMSSLLIIAGTAFFAVTSNNSTTSKEDLALIGTSVTLCLKLTGIMTGIVKGFVGLELSLKGAVVQSWLFQKGAFQLIDQNQQQHYCEPAAPVDWPRNNTVEFKNVTLTQEGLSEPTVKDLSLRVESGEKLVLCSKDGSSKACLLGVCRLISPVNSANDPQSSGIFVGEVNINAIGRKFIAERVMIVNELPLLFSSTVRENMDPFNLYSDEEIQRVLESVGMWEELHPNPSKQPNLLKMSQADGKLLHILEDGGAEFSLGLQQKLAIARVLLRRPSVLLMDSATSSLDEQVEQEIEALLRKELNKSTMLIITQQVDTTVESDKSVYLLKGHLKQFGNPLELLRNVKGRFANMIRKINPMLYEKMLAKAPKKSESVDQPSTKEVRVKPKNFDDEMDAFRNRL